MSVRDPVDTIRVRGGSGLSAPDTDQMRSVSLWLSSAAQAATRSVAQLGSARDQLNQAAQAWLAQALTVTVIAPANAAAGLKLTASQVANLPWEWHQARVEADKRRAELQGRAARARAVSDQIGGVRQVLQGFAVDTDKARLALLKAAGIYETAENKVLLEFRRSVHLASQLFKGGKFSQWLVPAISPYSDELISAVSLGSVPMTATVLARIAHAIVPSTKLVVTETVPGHGPLLGCPSPMPAWQGQPSGTIQQLLSRVGDLHPFDPLAKVEPGVASSGKYPDCSRTGLPKGTIAIERITNANPGARAVTSTLPQPNLASVVARQNPTSASQTTWVVLIPGTQNFAPGEHAFDGVTDLDLMSGGPSQVSEQVMKALDLVGAAKGEPIVLVGHSLGGIAAASIAASPEFNTRYDLGGVVTVGSPTATFKAVPGVPYLHVENDEEVVSNLDGKSGDQAPNSENRVTITRRLSASADPEDQAASKSLTGAHPIETHQRTLELAMESGNPAVHTIVAELEILLSGDESETRFFTGRRTAE